MAGEEQGSAYDPFPSFAEWGAVFDPTVADQYAARLDARRAEVSQAAMDRAVEVATRYAAVDTGAIEGLYTTNRGFTRTIATQSAAWEAALAQRDESVARSIQDALDGYEMVLDAVTGSTPISESWIRQLHETICASQSTYSVLTEVGPQEQPLPKGSYKQLPNSPTNADTGVMHHYAPPDDIGPEMQRLVDELRTDQFMTAHPVLQAAYSHYAFVCVHPFADGNGRVARALASLYLYRRPGVPLVVFADQKDSYIDALEAADRGEAQLFVSFVEQRALDATDLVIATSQTLAPDETESAIAAIKKDLNDQSGLTHAAIEALAARIAKMTNSAIGRAAAKRDLTPEIEFSRVDPLTARPDQVPDGYRASGGYQIGWTLSVTPPPEVTVSGRVTIWTRKSPSAAPDFVVQDGTGGPSVEIRIRDIHPLETQLLDLKLQNFSESFFSHRLSQLRHAVHAKVIDQGYAAGDADG